MSTDKVTENAPAHDHYRSDALIATGATLSVLLLGGVLQMISPNTDKMATESAVSEPMTAYSETASSPDENAESLEMTDSEFVDSASDMTKEMPQASESNSFTSETPTDAAATAPTETESATMMAAAVPTITDPATVQQLNNQVFDKINQNWTEVPTFTQNLVYQVKVTEAGAIASYDAITQAAKDYSNEIPLPSLIESNFNEGQMAKFVVVFTPGGQLEVSPWMAN